MSQFSAILNKTLYCTDASYTRTLSVLQRLSTLAQSPRFVSCSCVSTCDGVVQSTSVDNDTHLSVYCCTFFLALLFNVLALIFLTYCTAAACTCPMTMSIFQQHGCTVAPVEISAESRIPCAFPFTTSAPTYV